MTIGIFIEYGGQVVQMPVNPEEFDYSKESANETTDIVKLGEVNRLGITSLAEVSFESFFPFHPVGSYVQTKNKFWKPAKYIDFIEKIRREKKPCRFIITGTKVNMLASIESFEWHHEAGVHEDVYYTLELKEYRPHSAKYVKVVKQVTTPKKTVTATKKKQPASTNKKVTVGCTVMVNGRLHRDSYGTGPGKTEKNAKRKVNKIAAGRKYPYHVTMLDGGWRGWVTANSVKVL